jgi:hypothetical protein
MCNFANSTNVLQNKKLAERFVSFIYIYELFSFVIKHFVFYMRKYFVTENFVYIMSEFQMQKMIGKKLKVQFVILIK